MKVSQVTKAAATLCLLNFSVGYAFANAISEVEPNDSIAGAQNIDASFSVSLNPDIVNSTDWPWVSIAGTGDDTFDYYSFEVPEAGTEGAFDIDYGVSNPGSMDSELFLYDAAGNLLSANDDSSASQGGSGSTSGLDSYISHTFSSAGTYIVVVGIFNTFGNPGGVSGNTPDTGDTYTLQVSLSEHLMDSDGDGIADDEDCQPNSDMNPTVMLQDCDTGTENILFEDGCSIADLVAACAEGSDKKGAFSNCVADVTKQLKKDGTISGADFGAIQSCAVRSDIEK